MSNYFKGRLDDVAVWHGALTRREMALLYNGGTPDNLLNHPRRHDIAAWWRETSPPCTWTATNQIPNI